LLHMYLLSYYSPVSSKCSKAATLSPSTVRSS
jgi:hypothetical protein